MRIVRKGNAIKERTYLVLIDIFILMCAMGVSLGILFITLSPAFGFKQDTENNIKVFPTRSKIQSKLFFDTLINTVEITDRYTADTAMDAAIKNKSLKIKINHSKHDYYMQAIVKDDEWNVKLYQFEGEIATNIYDTLKISVSSKMKITNIPESDTVKLNIRYYPGKTKNPEKGLIDWIR